MDRALYNQTGLSVFFSIFNCVKEEQWLGMWEGNLKSDPDIESLCHTGQSLLPWASAAWFPKLPVMKPCTPLESVRGWKGVVWWNALQKSWSAQ